MTLTGRRREIAQVERLLERASRGSGGVLVLAGPEGSGRTALASLAADAARRRGFDVHRAAVVAGRPGRWAWAQLLRHALWAASRGLPGPARSLSAALAGLPPDGDPVVQLALLAESAEGFLDIDAGLVRLLEAVLPRVTSEDDRARLLARLARALLG